MCAPTAEVQRVRELRSLCVILPALTDGLLWAMQKLFKDIKPDSSVDAGQVGLLCSHTLQMSADTPRQSSA